MVHRITTESTFATAFGDDMKLCSAVVVGYSGADTFDRFTSLSFALDGRVDVITMTPQDDSESLSTIQDLANRIFDAAECVRELSKFGNVAIDIGRARHHSAEHSRAYVITAVVDILERRFMDDYDDEKWLEACDAAVLNAFRDTASTSTAMAAS